MTLFTWLCLCSFIVSSLRFPAFSLLLWHTLYAALARSKRTYCSISSMYSFVGLLRSYLKQPIRSLSPFPRGISWALPRLWMKISVFENIFLMRPNKLHHHPTNDRKWLLLPPHRRQRVPVHRAISTRFYQTSQLPQRRMLRISGIFIPACATFARACQKLLSDALALTQYIQPPTVP